MLDYNKGVDIHLHETSPAGVAAVNYMVETVEKTPALKGKLTISHAFALATLNEQQVDEIATRMAAQQVTIASTVPIGTLHMPLKQLREKGVFNMLLSDGRYVMAFCSTNLFWITRRAPFGVATLLDQDVEIDFQKETTPNDVVTVIATQPLTGNETWQKIMPGEWALFCLGDRVI